MDENNSFTPEAPKKKKKATVSSIVSVVLFVIAYRLFGILETLIGLAAGFGLRALLKKNRPEAKWVDAVCILVGVLIAFVLAIVAGIFLAGI